ncbi:VOC family protein [Thalassotalea ganghwensis]
MMTKLIGAMGWLDLTVNNAQETKDFYQRVVGWGVQETNMGDYHDYTMTLPDNDQVVAGICHAKGSNKDLPATWMPYFIVENLETALAEVVANNGEQLSDIKRFGEDAFCFIEDPAGATCALYQKG